MKGISPTLGAVFVAEIGEVTRFPTAGALCCWAGLTPRHYESDKTVHRGHISNEGDALIRCAAVEAIERQTEPAVKTTISVAWRTVGGAPRLWRHWRRTEWATCSYTPGGSRPVARCG
jgi:transposase